MRMSKSLGAWTRREALLGAFLGAAAAVATLSVPLHAPWLKAAGLLVAVAGALAGLLIAWRRARLEGQRERAEMNRRLRVPVGAVSEVDPTLIGVDKAAPAVYAAESLPKYVPRKVDQHLHAAIEAALAGTGPWLVVAVGASKVGKSRSLFEALLCCAPSCRLQLVAPVNAEALYSMLQPGQAVLTDEPAVLWLDDLEPFLNEGVTLQTLREWHSGGPVRIVVATYGGKGSELVASSTIGGLTTIAADVLQHAREITVDPTTAGEVQGLRQKLTDTEYNALCQYGLAAYLVAGQFLRRKLITARHSPGDAVCPEGVAVVSAAIDWGSCGRTDPISADTLKALWPKYSRSADAETDDGFRIGLDWALRPVAASIALLEHNDGYQAYDYVVRLRQEQSDATPPPDAMWSAAIDTASPPQAYGVALAALNAGRPTDALQAILKAADAQVAEISANAGVILGTVLYKLNRFDDAAAAYQRVADRYRDDPDPNLRAVAALALSQHAIWMMTTAGQSDGAFSILEEIVDRYGNDPDPAPRAAAVRALNSQAARLRMRGQPDEALAILQGVFERYGDEPAPVVRGAVASSLFQQGSTLEGLDRPDDAMDLYERVIERFEKESGRNCREAVAQARCGQGRLLKRSGRLEEAVTAYQRVIESLDHDRDRIGRLVMIEALRGYADGLEVVGRLHDAMVVYRQIFDRQTDYPEAHRNRVAAEATRGQANVLRRLGRAEEAMAMYERIIDEHSGDHDLIVRMNVAQALSGLAAALEDLHRSEEAMATYQQIIDRYSDDAHLRKVVQQAASSLQR
jgi:tetratricopeptide (TPR) repeat protein